MSGSAPKIFSRTTRSGLPHVAVGVCSCFAFLAYLTVNNGPTEAFKWLSGFCATAGFITWFSIGVTYLRFYKGMKAQGIDRKAFLPFAPRVQPFAAWWCVCGTTFVLFVRPSFSRVETIVTKVHLTPGTSVMNHSSLALGTCSSTVTGLLTRS